MAEATYNRGYFNEEVLQSSVPVLVHFGADWCKTCTQLSPYIQELANDFSERAKFVEVDVENNEEIVKRYDIKSIPTLVIFKDGEQVQRWVGFTKKNTLSCGLKDFLE